ncbi:hypothetical protein NDU88_006632 [Pleurodeles waltl]|uniref:Uncharacterized protein n=1 Tax=Pleurodeles waltl TaxID=8319 RepID=A0AAV7QMC3_PLEWA|nr:hypothetical protein NDU88_006632 [Pleurodeles waltl]
MPYAPSLPISAIPECPGLRATHQVQDWEASGITTWADVLSEECFYGLDVLALDHGLGPKQLLLYSALQDVVRNTWGSDLEHSPMRAPLEAA